MSSQKRQKHRKKKNLPELEPLFRGCKQALINDLSDHNIDRIFLNKGRKGYGPPMGCTPYLFKQIQQLVQFDKRLIWSDDLPVEAIEKVGFADFMHSQDTFCLPEPMSRRATLVMERAREICHEILGYFSYDTWFDSCSFGKRAAKGLKRREAYLDKRFDVISGTAKQLAAFNEALSRDIHLLRAVRKRSRKRTNVNVIDVTAVPKSWKAVRIIAPDTILGGFLSRGLGEVIRDRLEKKTHINLQKQQERHRRWAQIASKTGHLSTIDMSKASDSFVWRHIEELVPLDWLPALDVVRTGIAKIPIGHHGKHIQLKSYMLMGSGHTFPLQTLLFYCLAEATRTLLKSRGKVSVYGDDIMLPTRIARPFIVVMSELGFTINSEKSFYDEPNPDTPSHTFFRESCGGDFKGGIDVRPYMPECDLQDKGNKKVPVNRYVSWCHKLINGLLDRWSIEEIPLTVLYLLREINNKKRKICFVPESEVAHAGITHHIPPKYLLGLDVSPILIDPVTQCPSYWRLVLENKKRARKQDERPYVWYSYWLKRKEKFERLPQVVTNFIDFIKTIDEDPQGDDLYSSPIQLAGEDRKDQEGEFRWSNNEDQRKRRNKGNPS